MSRPAGDRHLKCRGVWLVSRHDCPHELATLVWLIERLPAAVCQQLTWMQADGANSVLAVAGEWRTAPLIGQIIADELAGRFGQSFVTIEAEDAEMRGTSIESSYPREEVRH
jgi:hypothetical protein